MINIQSVSTNAFTVSAFSYNGFNTNLTIGPGGHCSVPGLNVGGEVVGGGIKFAGSYVISDGPAGPYATLLLEHPPVEWALYGGACALTLLAVNFLGRMIKRGIGTGRSVTYD